MRHSGNRTAGGIVAGIILLGLAFPPGGWAAQPTSPTKAIQTGALIWVAPESPYYEAGLRTRDLIIEGNGQRIRHEGDFYKVFAATTDTATITAKGLRGGKPFSATVPAYLPADVTVSGYAWDWARYLKYYAPDPTKPDPDLHRGYQLFDRRSYPEAQIALTAATKKGVKDPLTLTKLAWLLLYRTSSKGGKSGVEQAGALLKQAEQAFDPTRGDRDTESKLHGTYMVYYRRAGNSKLAGVHGRKAISLAPHVVGNRQNYYQTLITAKEYNDATMATSALARDYPRSVQFQRMKKSAHERANQIKGVVEASKALVEMMPEDLPTRLQLLPYLNQAGDNFNLLLECDRLLEKKGSQLTNLQKGEIHYHKAQVHFRRKDLRKAQPLARQAVQLRNQGADHYLYAEILHGRGKWKDAVISYRQALKKGAISRSSPQWRGLSRSEYQAQYKTMMAKVDESIEHLWAWQIKDLPDDVKSYVLKRKEWLKEREVLKHSFVMRNRYEIRNALIVIGVLMIVAGIALKVFVTEF